MSKSSAPPRYAIVTGGARGLGREFCRALARDGHHVAIVDVDGAGATETLRMIEEHGGLAQVELCDVTDAAAWLSLRARLEPQWPQLDLLVNNAGMFGSGFVGTLDMAEAERLIRLNLLSVLYGCHAMVPWLIASAAGSASRARRPHVINVASSFAYLCPPGMAPYNLSKAGVVAFSETLYGELKPRGVGVTVVCPGPMPTRFLESASFGSPVFRQLTESFVRESTLDPAVVAAAALKASRRRQLYVVMGANHRWYWRLKRLMPVTLLDRVARRVRKDLKNLEKT